MLLLSVVALIVIQTFQILQLYERKENQFDEKVKEALNRIAYRHEKAEEYKRYLQIVNRDFSGEYREILKDEFKELISSRETISIRDTNVFISGRKEQFLILQGDVFDTLSGLSAQQKVLIRDVREVKDLLTNKVDTSKMAIELNQKVTQQIFKKAKFINEMMIEAFRDNIHISPESRIELFFLDSVIKEEFQRDGLPNDYNFSILNKDNELLALDSESKNYNSKISIDKSSFSVKLFPSNIFDEDLFLFVKFPGKENYLYSEMRNTFLATGALVIFIVVALIFMFKTILQQKKLSELKSDFISNMTHEFKTPISTISLACQAALDADVVRSETGKEDWKPLIDVIKTENKRLELLVESILQNAVVDKGSYKGNIELINLEKLLKEIIENTTFRLNNKNGNILFHPDGHEYFIESDRIHLTNLLANLFDNAVKYSNEVPKIIVELRKTPRFIVLSIKDNGIGIQKEYLSKIFDKLFRVPTGNVHNVKGFGLGLSYVKSICDNYGWKIAVDSKIGEGTTFIIKFNLKNNERKA